MGAFHKELKLNGLEIAKKYYGHKHLWKKIYNANHDLIHKTAKKHGHRHSHYGKYIYPGCKFVIP